MGYESLVTIPILINAVGDGLAEPVGIRYGKRKYTVKALFTNQTFTRSIEGSSAVFITGVLVMLLYAGEFTSMQFLVGLALVPIAMTFTEAYSPHAWDTPFLMLVGYGTLMTVLQF
jgi:phytol kinase